MPEAAFIEGSPRRMLSSTTASSPKLSCTMPSGTIARASTNKAARMGGGSGRPALKATTMNARRLPMVVNVSQSPEEAKPESGS